MFSSLTSGLHSPPCIIGLSIIGIMIAISSHYARGRIALFWLAVCVLITPLYGYLTWVGLHLPRNPAKSAFAFRNQSWSMWFSVLALFIIVSQGIIEGGWRRKRAK